MAEFSVKADGIERIIKLFAEASDKVNQQVAEIVTEAAYETRDNAKATVPVRTGALKSSIRAYQYNNNTKSALVTAGNRNAYYAPFVEFGTGKRFQIPGYRNLDLNSLEAYAYTFRKIPPKRAINTPYNPYMFTSFSNAYSKMMSRLGKLKIT